MLGASAVGIRVVIAIYFLAEPFINLYLGEQWVDAASILVILAPMVGLSSICLSLVTAVFVLKRVHWLLFLNLGTTSAQLLSYWLGQSMLLNFTTFLTLVAVLMSGVYLAFLLCMTRAVWSNETRTGPR